MLICHPVMLIFTPNVSVQAHRASVVGDLIFLPESASERKSSCTFRVTHQTFTACFIVPFGGDRLRNQRHMYMAALPFMGSDGLLGGAELCSVFPIVPNFN